MTADHYDVMVDLEIAAEADRLLDGEGPPRGAQPGTGAAASAG
jgi:hypothetical protein